MKKPATPRLLETIRLEDGRAALLDRHQERMDRSRTLHYGKQGSLKLAAILEGLDLPQQGVHKLRLVYGATLEHWEVQPYTVRPVRSLRVVEGNGLNYSHKYADRSGIEALLEERQDCDDILIIQRQHLTDSSYANLALYDGSRWYTPAWPLLRGARRAQLIADGVIQPTIIRRRDLVHFEQIRLFNAMMDWSEGPVVPLTAVAGI
ncbi:4-amino-4-deoxychorismate lyase [Lewinella marina]|uniref:4-amino-4-deoxychorismate lyase n=1 Tax=Neolewinella marina TaxID=438751 RepID=A0A2G0CFN1_9BACT|nr:aminotransferase class IV [Neolewinella marina]NJB85523.1 4-amino-4-deoxychorismate lyase [Neolewinella marina]PHK98788.1 hypothetical protein CGL56_10015 [Neolewinella marina]